SYYRLGPWDDEPADPDEDRFDQLDDLVSTTAQAFLGLTLGCARCHDHKFEPLTMHDYYRMVAVFRSLRRPRIDRTELDLPAAPPAEIRAALRPALPALGHALAVPHGPSAVVAVRRLRDALKPLDALPRGYFLYEPSPEPPATHLLIRGKAT